MAKLPVKKVPETPSKEDGVNYIVAKAIGAIMGQDADNIEKLKKADKGLNVSVSGFMGLKEADIQTFLQSAGGNEMHDNLLSDLISTGEELIKHLPSTDAYYASIEGMHKLLEKFAGEKSIEEKTIKVTVEGGESLEKLQQTLEKLVEVNSKDKEINLEPIIIHLDSLKELFEKHVNETAQAIVNNTKNIEIIQEGQKKAEETALLGADVDEKELEKSKMSALDLCGGIAIMAMTMLIGGYIIQKNPGIIKDSLLFGAALTGFLMMLLIPIGTINIISQKANDKALEAVIKFVIVSAIVMIIGGLFMLIKDMAKSSLKFAAVFSLFLTMMLAPLLVMGVIVSSDAFKNAESIGKLIMICASVMIIGALVMMLGGGKFIKNSLLFGVTLMAFIALVLLPFVFVGRFLKEAMKSAEGIGQLIIICAGVMIIGALFMFIPDLWKKALTFGIVLSLFIAEILLATLLMKFIIGPYTEKTLKQLTIFMITTTIILLIGALFMLSDKLWKNSLLFGVVLMVFLALILLPFAIFKSVIRMALKSLREIIIFVLAATFIMLIGAVIMVKEPWIILGALGFAAAIFAFISAILLPIKIFSPYFNSALKDLLKFGIFVAICAFVLIIGGYITMKEPWILLGAAGFAVALIGFMTALVIPIAFYSEFINDGLKDIVKFGIFVAICAAVLMVGAWFMLKDPQHPIAALEFCGIISLFLLALAGTMWIMSKAKGIDSGTAQLLKISIAVAIMSAVMIAAAETAKIIDPMKGTFLEVVAIMCGTMVAFGVMASVLGMPPIVAFATAGASVLMMLSGAAALMGLAVLEIAKAVQLISTINEDDCDKIGSVIKSFIGGITDAMSFRTMIKLAAAMCVVPAIMLMGMAVSRIAKGVADMANLTVGTKWDKDGNAIEFRQLNSSDFDLAAENVKKIVLTIGGALVELYNMEGAKELFAPPAPSFFWRRPSKSPSEIVIGACIRMGTMIASISAGVAAMASLTIPIEWNDKGDPIKYRTLKPEDFTAAAENIKTIITTVGKAIIDVYSLPGASEMFEQPRARFWEKPKASPFELVISACFRMGKMIGSISAGIAAMANMQVATEWNDEGTPIKYRSLKDTDLKLASDNIGDIITNTGSALIGLYTSKPWMFDDGDDSPFNRVVKASVRIGEVISSIAGGVAAMATLQIATEWDKNGKPIKFRGLTYKDMFKAAFGTRMIITTLARGLERVYYSDPWMFWRGEKSIINKTIDVSLRIGEVISSIAGGVAAMANMQIATKWNKEGKPIKFRSLTFKDMVKASFYTRYLIRSMARGLQDIFWSDPWIFSKDDKSPLNRVVDASLKIGEVLSAIGTGVAAMASLQVATAWNKEGVPIKFRELKSSDFVKASVHTRYIISSLARGLSKVFKTDPWIFATDSKSPLNRVIEASKSICEVISNVAKSVADIASLQIATKWNSEGKPIKYRELTSKDFILAAVHTRLIIVTLARALSNAYLSNKEFFTTDKKSPINIVIDGVTRFGEVISSLATGIGNMASLNIPTSWDKNGKPTKFRSISENDFKLAEQHIWKIILTMAWSFGNAYRANKEIFENNKVIDTMKRNLIVMSTTLYYTASNMVKSSMLAGKVTDYKSLSIVLTLSNTFGKIYTRHSKLFGDTKIVSNIATNILNLSHAVYRATKYMAKSAMLAKKATPEEFNALKDSMLNFIAETSNVYADLSVMQDVEETIDKYVKTVNELKLSKINGLCMLLDKLDNLSQHMGDLDKLVEALAGEFTETLATLADRINGASQVIRQSDRIQQQRHKLIDASIEKIQNMMGNALKVEVTAKDAVLEAFEKHD